MTPYQFIRIQLGCISGKEVQSQAARSGCDVVLHACCLVGRETIEHEMNRFSAVLHHLLQQLDEQFRVEGAIVGAKPERPICIHRRSRADGLTLSRALHYRRLSTNSPCLAMHRVGTESRFIPEKDVSAFRLGLLSNGREGLALPHLNGFRIALIGSLKRFLWRQSQTGKKFTDRRHAEFDSELLL